MKLAKSNGLEFKIHSKIVEITSVLLLKKLVNAQTFERFESTIRILSLLHDIGKLTLNFQRFLKGELKKPGMKFRHNEIGWAIISKYLSDDYPNKDIILNSVYWHHGISNKIGKHTDSEILNSLSDEDIKTMVNYLTECVGEDNLSNELNSDSVFSPLFYPNNNKLIQLILCRSILITSDRISSDLNDLDLVNDILIDNYFNNSSTHDTSKCEFNGNKRFEKQKEIVSKIKKTTIINAPAGFGKTMLGLLYGIQQNKKILWVTPRNIVAESAYHSILQDCKHLGISVSIQLIINGKIIKTNTPSLGHYSADIIVTNIDNYLAPSFKNEIMDSSSLLLGCYLVLDEYHELVTSAPYMSLFINIMQIRHRLTNSNTLLISATGFDIEWLWDTLEEKTTILPGKHQHYPAQHDKKYFVKFLTKHTPVKPNTNTFVFKNTIKASQIEKRNGEYSLLSHSEFTIDKKEKDFEYLIENYGKNSEVIDNKANIVGTHIIQASLDISSKHMVEDIFSPHFTNQRFGRCNRSGEFGDDSTVTIVKEELNDSNYNYLKGENYIKDMLYSKSLSDAWADALIVHNQKYITLDDLYITFNKFSKDFEIETKRFIQSKLDESKLYLDKIYPIKFNDNKEEKDVKTAGSNKLRSTNNEIFYIVKHESKNKWIGLFNKEMFKDFDIIFKEKSNVNREMIKVMKELCDSNDKRFNFKDIIKNPNSTLDSIRRLAKKSNTPYIVFNCVYNDELGVISNEINY